MNSGWFVVIFLVLSTCVTSNAAWSYTDPKLWHTSAPACGTQATSERQSPIDLPVPTAGEGEIRPLVISYASSDTNTLDVANNGNSLFVKFPTEEGTQGTITGGRLPAGKTYNLDHFHFHWGSDNSKGSEHFVDGKAYPLEMHLVHWDSSNANLGDSVLRPDGLAVYGVFFEIGAHNNELQKFLDHILEIEETDSTTKITSAFDVSLLLPAHASTMFWSYDGSLTTPPCAETVTWTVGYNVLTISQGQMDSFRTLKNALGSEIGHNGNNFRPLQPLNGRVVYSSLGNNKGHDELR